MEFRLNKPPSLLDSRLKKKQQQQQQYINIHYITNFEVFSFVAQPFPTSQLPKQNQKKKGLDSTPITSSKVNLQQRIDQKERIKKEKQQKKKSTLKNIKESAN